MEKDFRVVVVLLCSLPTMGCATFLSLQKLQDPKDSLFYAGTRLDWAAIREDREALHRYALRDLHPPGCPEVDLPASLVADTLLAPRTIWTIGGR